MEPESFGPAQLGESAERIDGAGTDRARGADDEEGRQAIGAIAGDAFGKRGDVHAALCVYRNPTHRRTAKAAQIRRLLDPGMGFGRTIRHQRGGVRRTKALLPHVPRGLGRARGPEPHHVGHVAAAHQEPAGSRRRADELADPGHGLLFDERRHRRQAPRTAVGVHRRRQQLCQRAQRRRRRGDVAHEARVAVEDGVGQHQLCRAGEQQVRVGALLGQRPLPQHRAKVGGGSAWRHRTRRQGAQKIRELVNEPMAKPTEIGGRKVERRRTRHGPKTPRGRQQSRRREDARIRCGLADPTHRLIAPSRLRAFVTVA